MNGVWLPKNHNLVVILVRKIHVNVVSAAHVAIVVSEKATKTINYYYNFEILHGVG